MYIYAYALFVVRFFLSAHGVSFCPFACILVLKRVLCCLHLHAVSVTLSLRACTLFLDFSFFLFLFSFFSFVFSLSLFLIIRWWEQKSVEMMSSTLSCVLQCVAVCCSVLLFVTICRRQHKRVLIMSGTL